MSSKERGFIIGVDEAGRGPLAGPLVVAAVAVPRHVQFRHKAGGALRDSKQMTPLQRERWFQYIMEHDYIAYTVSWVTPRVIDNINIARAADRAATRAVGRLVTQENLPTNNTTVLLDGALYLTNDIPYRTVVRGDTIFRAIKLAAIVAKVYRDSVMTRLDLVHREYGFAQHKGYGTRMHYKRLRMYGPSPVHRLSFISFLKDS
ncbi:MAG TPA: ribonuclease HII [Candidatus Jorgensenbacteria bacterium]|uniref:Ribonuclease HII n=1 Tax=marine sediment metagenome TaxID=412755 RepID=A0A0F9M9H1_9ZZZZ|nr:ribonuclease HII [Candidatus Jorgensenbacteria bacterium]